jgi:predicted Zn-dependent protease
MKFAVIFLVVLGGCASVPGPEQPAPVEEPAATTTAKPENNAVAGLMDTARADVAANRLGSAAATLERALRIEPRNPRLWHELARVRLRQGDYAQAEGTAARSNAWSGADSELRAANQRIIEEARAARR